MNLKIILAGLIVLLVFGFSFLVRVYQGTSDTSDNLLRIENSTTNTTASANQSSSGTGGTTESTLIPIATLAQHASASDCWIAYKGKVYDMTSYLDRHPGGTNAIARYCGSASEFEQAFTRQHGTSKAGLLVKVATFIGDFDVKGPLGN